MRMTCKFIIKQLAPPIIWKLLACVRSSKKSVEWLGSYASWNEAQKNCSTYSSGPILEKVVASTRKVISGEAVYERDSFVFDHIEYSWPLLSALLWVHARYGMLNLVDFGGSLGSTYRQNQKYLGILPNVSWTIVEQAHFVKIGKQEFTNGPLKFCDSLQEVENPNCILFASTLCYLEDPWSVIKDARSRNASCIIVERTPFHDGLEDIIRVQIVRPPIYNASYPCRIFSQSTFNAYLAELGYCLLESWESEMQPDSECTYKGQLWRLI